MKTTAEQNIPTRRLELNGASKRRISLLVVFAVLACLGCMISVMKGSVEIPLEEILAVFRGQSIGTHQQILMNIRLPLNFGGRFGGNQSVPFGSYFAGHYEKSFGGSAYYRCFVRGGFGGNSRDVIVAGI